MNAFLRTVVLSAVVLVVAGCGGGGGGGTVTSDGVVAQIPSPVCGDGVVASLEQCDDGNEIDNDGCSSDCKMGFARTYGDSAIFGATSNKGAKFSSILQTADGGFVIAGCNGYCDTDDAWILKLDSAGEMVWENDGGDYYYATDIAPTQDGGYIVSGYRWTPIPLNDPFWSSSKDEAVVVKLNSKGVQEWEYIRDGMFYTVLQTVDGAYIAAGKDYDEALLVRLDSRGNADWGRTMGSEISDCINSIRLTSDGSYIAAGRLDSDFWVVKFDADGEKVWEKVFEGDSSGWGGDIALASDGGYVAVGQKQIDDSKYRMWIIKLDQSGSQEWAIESGDSGSRYASSINRTSDGGYLIGGSVGTYLGGMVLRKITSSGSTQWSKVYGEGILTTAESVLQTPDGGYVVTGHTTSIASDLDYYALIMKLDSSGNCNGCEF